MFITKSNINIQSNLRQRASSYESVILMTKCIFPSLWVACVYVLFLDVSRQLIKLQPFKNINQSSLCPFRNLKYTSLMVHKIVVNPLCYFLQACL